MFGKKSYGEYKTESCAFCGATSYKRNKQGLAVCKQHQAEEGLPDLRCMCGLSLDVLSGKYGTYCRCMVCGNVNLQKALTFNQSLPKKSNTSGERKQEPRPPSAPEYPILIQEDKVTRVRADQL